MSAPRCAIRQTVVWIKSVSTCVRDWRGKPAIPGAKPCVQRFGSGLAAKARPRLTGGTPKSFTIRVDSYNKSRINSDNKFLKSYYELRCMHYVIRIKLYALRTTRLHIPPVLSAHFEQGIGNLPQRTVFYRFHQFFEDVVVLHRRILNCLQHLTCIGFVAFV